MVPFVLCPGFGSSLTFRGNTAFLTGWFPLLSPVKEKSPNKSFSIKFSIKFNYSPKSWQLQGHILPQKWIKRGLRDDPEEQTPEGLLSWQNISKTYFPSSGVRLCLQSKVWPSFIIVVSADLWKLWFSCPYIIFTENPIGIFFRKYHYKVGISEDIYIMYPNILFLHYQGVEESRFTPLLITCSVAACTAAGW